MQRLTNLIPWAAWPTGRIQGGGWLSGFRRIELHERRHSSMDGGRTVW